MQQKNKKHSIVLLYRMLPFSNSVWKNTILPEHSGTNRSVPTLYALLVWLSTY